MALMFGMLVFYSEATGFVKSSNTIIGLIFCLSRKLRRRLLQTIGSERDSY